MTDSGNETQHRESHTGRPGDRRLSLNILPALGFLLFGLIMIYGSITMEPSFSGTNEHRWVPLGMSVFVSLLSGWVLLQQLMSSNHSSVSPEGAPLEHRHFFLLVLPCILLLAAYAQLYVWFGYAAATGGCGALVFKLFRNSLLASVVQSAIATLVLYFIFFKLLKLYNPPGRLLDLSLPF